MQCFIELKLTIFALSCRNTSLFVCHKWGQSMWLLHDIVVVILVVELLLHRTKVKLLWLPQAIWRIIVEIIRGNRHGLMWELTLAAWGTSWLCPTWWQKRIDASTKGWLLQMVIELVRCKVVTHRRHWLLLLLVREPARMATIIYWVLVWWSMLLLLLLLVKHLLLTWIILITIQLLGWALWTIELMLLLKVWWRRAKQLSLQIRIWLT